MRITKDFIQRVATDVIFYGGSLNGDFGLSLSPEKNNVVIAHGDSPLDEQINTAARVGALGLLCNNKNVSSERIDGIDIAIIAVEDVDATLFKLAHAWRAKFTIPFIGVTGSFGKTSVVRCLVNILQESGKRVYFTSDHVRTDRQFLVSILNVADTHEVAVFEVAATRRGSMRRLAQALRPTTAVITGVGHANLQGLGSLEDAVAEMKHIFDEFGEDSVGVIHGDQPLLARAGYTHPVIKFGAKTTNQVQARKVMIHDESIAFVLKLYGEKHRINLHGSHERYVHNALAAISVAYHLGVSLDSLIKGVEKRLEVPSCFQFLPAKRSGLTLIDDTASLSPESTRASLFAFNELKTRRRKILVLSDMPSLGVNAPFWHRQIGRCITRLGSIDHVILVGDLVSWIQKVLPVSCKVSLMKDWQEVAAYLKSLPEDSYILVKGDQAQHFDKLIQALSL